MRTNFLFSHIVLATLNAATIVQLTNQSPSIAKKPRFLPDLNLRYELEDELAIGECETSSVSAPVLPVFDDQPHSQRKSSCLTVGPGTFQTTTHDAGCQITSAVGSKSKDSNDIATMVNDSTANQPILDQLYVQGLDRTVGVSRKRRNESSLQETRGYSDASDDETLASSRSKHHHELSSSGPEAASGYDSRSHINAINTYSWDFLRDEN